MSRKVNNLARVFMNSFSEKICTLIENANLIHRKECFLNAKIYLDYNLHDLLGYAWQNWRIKDPGCPAFRSDRFQGFAVVYDFDNYAFFFDFSQGRFAHDLNDVFYHHDFDCEKLPWLLYEDYKDGRFVA